MVNNMTINSLTNVKPLQSGNQHFDATEISCLNEKVHTLMRKISATNKELSEVKRELRNFDPALVGEQNYVKSAGILGAAVNCFLFLSYGIGKMGREGKISGLLFKKEALEKLRDVNHNWLEHYEQTLRKCETVYEQQYGQDLMPPEFYQSLLPEGTDIKEAFFCTDCQHGVQLLKTLPVGMGTNLEFLNAEERAQRVFERAMSCRVIKDLYIEAMLTKDPITGATGAPWTLLFPPEEFISPGVKEFGASCNSRDRIIYLNPSLSDDEALSSFVFELTNAVSANRFHKLIQDAEDGKIGSELFAKETERVEHEGALRHHSIMKVAIPEKKWSLELDTFRDLPHTFEVVWPYIASSSHTEFYRKAWEEINFIRTELEQEQRALSGCEIKFKAKVSQD
jgi:hypothetical protein